MSLVASNQRPQTVGEEIANSVSHGAGFLAALAVLPVLVGDYLAAHFAAYGALTGLCLLLLKWRHGLPPTAAVNARAFAAAVAAALLVIGATLTMAARRRS